MCTPVVLRTAIIVTAINAFIFYSFLLAANQDLFLPSNSTSWFSLWQTNGSVSLQNETAAINLTTTTNTTNTTRQNNLVLQEMKTKIIYYKTHKTASTTVGSIMLRFGASRGLKFLKSKSHYLDPKKDIANRIRRPVSDIVLYHHHSIPWEPMMKYYEAFIPGGQYIAVVRDPVRRYMSHFYYYYPKTEISFEKFLTLPNPRNILSRDFGIVDQRSLDDFLDRAYGKFFMLVTEKLDETLVLMKNLLGWQLTDILYLKLNDGCKAGFRQLDHIPMKCLPKFDELGPDVKDIMRKNNQLDEQLYARVFNDTKEILDQQTPGFWEEVRQFKEMRADLEDLCDVKKSPPLALCEPYLWFDLEYEARIANDGFVYNVSIANVKPRTSKW